MERLKIKEAVIVEGRDDTINLSRAVDCLTIETHGFGIKDETVELIEKAYREIGIIIFTDPDYSGEEIRRKLSEKFPSALHAYISRDDALKKGDIGIENASPEAIRHAIIKARRGVFGSEKDSLVSKKGGSVSEKDSFGSEKDNSGSSCDSNSFVFTLETVENAGLSGKEDSKKRREMLGSILGIGYSNVKSFLNKLNRFGISKEEFDEALSTINNKRDK